MLRCLLCLIALAAAGCGGSGPVEGSRSCTYDGALKGKLPCQLASASVSSGRTLLKVLSTDVPSPVLSVEFGFAGTPMLGHYVGDSGSTSCSIVLEDLDAHSVWYASTVPTERNGSCELTLGAARLLNDGLGTQYKLHGTFIVTLAAAENAKGEIQLSGGF